MVGDTKASSVTYFRVVSAAVFRYIATGIPSIGDHFYTTNWRELGRGRNGWRYEGVQCYVMTRAIVTTSPDESEDFEEQPYEFQSEVQSFKAYAGTEWPSGVTAEGEAPMELGFSSFSVSGEEEAPLDSDAPTDSFDTLENVPFGSDEPMSGSFEGSFETSLSEIDRETEKEVSSGPESFQLESGESIEGVTVNVNVFKR